MNVLVIDTALEACAVGIAREGAPPILRSEIIGRGHAERLFGLVEDALAEAKLQLADFGRLGVTTGPGSFTGIRVGVAAVRGFALVTGAEGVGHSTLAVHAWTARAQVGASPVLAVLPAKGGAFFAQLFDPDGAAMEDPLVALPDDLADRATRAGASLAGAGAEEIARDGIAIAHTRTTPELAALLAMTQAGHPGATPPRPVYVKPPDAAPAKPQIARR